MKEAFAKEALFPDWVLLVHHDTAEGENVEKVFKGSRILLISAESSCGPYETPALER